MSTDTRHDLPTGEQVDAALREVMAEASGGLDFEDVVGVIRDTVTAMRRAIEVLKRAEYDAAKPGEAARAVSQMGKVLDDTFRLLQFAKGAPDSRPDLGGDWLRALSAEQLRVVQGWIEAAGVERR